MNVNLLIDDLKRDEGVRLMPYRDSVGKLTIGVGRNIEDRGITARETGVMLATDIEIVFGELDANIPGWRELPEPCQRGLANMCFNLGWPRLSKFKNMIEALRTGDYARAAAEALNSQWSQQVGGRAERIAELYRSAAS